MDQEAMIEALRGPSRMAGDIVPLPIAPGPNAGPSPNSAVYGWGDKNQPGVLGIGPENMQNWLNALRARQSPGVYQR